MNSRSSFLVACLLTWFFFGSPASPAVATAPPTSSSRYTGELEALRRPNKASTPLYHFIENVSNGQAASLTGVYVKGLMALPVIQQPARDAAYVSNQDDTLTQFAMASDYGTTGILAHNMLSGAFFNDLQLDQRVYLVYGDGSISTYEVTSVHRYMALSPASPFSNFVDIEQPGQVITSTELFETVYQSTHDQVVFQTCIANGFEHSWGRLFVTAHQVAGDHLPAGFRFRIE